MRAFIGSIVVAVVLSGAARPAAAQQTFDGTTLQTRPDGTSSAPQTILVLPIVDTRFAYNPATRNVFPPGVNRQDIVNEYNKLHDYWAEASFGKLNILNDVANCFYQVSSEFPNVGELPFKKVSYRGTELGFLGLTFNQAVFKYVTDPAQGEKTLTFTGKPSYASMQELQADLLLQLGAARDEIQLTVVTTGTFTGNLLLEMVEARTFQGSYIKVDHAATTPAVRNSLGLNEPTFTYDNATGKFLFTTDLIGSDLRSAAGQSITFSFASDTSSVSDFVWNLTNVDGTPLSQDGCSFCAEWHDLAGLKNVLRPAVAGSGDIHNATVEGQPQYQLEMNVGAGLGINGWTARVNNGNEGTLQRMGIATALRQVGTSRGRDINRDSQKLTSLAFDSFLKLETTGDMGCLVGEVPNSTVKADLDNFLKKYSAIHVFLLANAGSIRENASVWPALLTANLPSGAYNMETTVAALQLSGAASVIIHEFGHNLTFPDLYDYSNDESPLPSEFNPNLTFEGRWEVMSNQGDYPHPGVFIKQSFHRWISDVSGGQIRTIVPGSGQQTFTLTPSEHSAASYDALITPPNPVAKMIVLPLGGDTMPNGLPGHYLAIENRGQAATGAPFNTALPGGGGVHITDNIGNLGVNGADVKPISRSYSHTLVSSLAGSWPQVDGPPLAAASQLDTLHTFPSFPGVTIENLGSVNGPAGTPASFNVRVNYTVTDTVDLRIEPWRAPKEYGTPWIWFEPATSATPPALTVADIPTAAGNVHAPIASTGYLDSANGGKPLNWIHVAVQNKGSFATKNVRLKMSLNSPGGIGDPPGWRPLPGLEASAGITTTGKDIAAGATEIFSIPWSPGEDLSSKGHTCIAAEVITWDVQTFGQVSDIDPFNNTAQENILHMDVTGHSPWADVPFQVEVHNNYVRTTEVRLVTEGLKPGYSVTLDEPVLQVPGKASHVFTGTLHWDSNVIPFPPTQDPADPFWQACNADAIAPLPVTAPQCGSEWGLTAYGHVGDSYVKLGGVTFDTAGKPFGTVTSSITADANGNYVVTGSVSPPAAGQVVRIFIKYPDGHQDIVERVTSSGGKVTYTYTPTRGGIFSVCATLAREGSEFAPTTCDPVTIGNYERWNNVSGSAVAQIPFARDPDVVLNLPTLEVPSNVADNYGARVSGLIVAPATGNYRFFISGDDNVALFLSSDEKPTGKVRIAYHDGYTGVREWTKFATQRSAAIALVAGKRYYIEAQLKESSGTDHMAVGWLKPGDGGSVPTAIVPIDRAVPSLPKGDGYTIYEKWTDIAGSDVSSIPVNTVPEYTQHVTSLEGLVNIRDNYGARIRGWLTAPATGNYTFWIAGDDRVALYFSPQGGPEGKQRIAYHNGYTGRYEWNKFATQRSAAVGLVAGQRYYFEALMKEASGDDHFEVGWLLPGQTGSQPSEVVPGRQLSQYIDPSQPTCSSTELPRAAAIASSQESSSLAAAKAIDGNGATRWGSQFSDPQWLTVDLGQKQFVSRVKLTWESAASRNYDLQVSDNNSTWTTVYTDANGNGGIDDITGLAARARYVRMYSRARTTAYGNSLWEMQVYGDANESCSAVLGARLKSGPSPSESQGSCRAGRGERGAASALWVLGALAAARYRRRRRRVEHADGSRRSERSGGGL